MPSFRLALLGSAFLAVASPTLAQQVNPGSASGPSSVTVTALPPTPAGSNLVGKFGIDQTTPGSTNKVALDPSQPNAITSPAIGATTTNGSSTVTTGGTFQTALASSATRKGCLVQNPQTATETLYVYLGSGTASTANSVGLGPGGIFNCALSGAYVATDAVQLTGATTGHAYVLNSQ